LTDHLHSGPHHLCLESWASTDPLTRDFALHFAFWSRSSSALCGAPLSRLFPIVCVTIDIILNPKFLLEHTLYSASALIRLQFLRFNDFALWKFVIESPFLHAIAAARWKGSIFNLDDWVLLATGQAVLRQSPGSGRAVLRCGTPFLANMATDSSSDAESVLSSPSRIATSAPSSPPPAETETEKLGQDEMQEEHMRQEEEKARTANEREEARRVAALKRRKKKAETRAEREAKARELDDLLRQTATFSDILTKKTQVLGRVGSGFDGKALGEHDLQMASQPECLVGGTMRDYQLEGLTWMMEICSQGMSGILADEMGLGGTHARACQESY
jgi:hypothetical protein